MRASPDFRVFILDDDPRFREKVGSAFLGRFSLTEADSESAFRQLWVPRVFDLLLLDMRLRRDREGLDVLRWVFAQDELQPVIMVSAYGDTESAIEAVGAGAMMFLHKREFTPALLGRMVEAVIEQGRLRRQVQALRQLAWAGDPDTLLGGSPGIREASAHLREAAETPGLVPVISGERGCGSTLAARLFHRYGYNPDGPFVEVIAESMRRGAAFYKGRHSPWEQAIGGTVAVDGVETLSRPTVEDLLQTQTFISSIINTPRVLLLHHIQPAGQLYGNGTVEAQSDISSWITNQEHVLPIVLPPLRQRREDIPLLATHFLQRQRAGGHTSARSISGAAMKRLESHSWPGNLCELRNVVEYAALQATAGGVEELDEENLPSGLSGFEFGSHERGHPTATGWDYHMHLARTEIELADRAVRERGISQKMALAKALGYTDRFTLMRRIRKALTDFPLLAREFPSVAGMFLKVRD